MRQPNVVPGTVSSGGCLHMGVHFYNTRDEIDRVMATLDELVTTHAGS